MIIWIALVLCGMLLIGLLTGCEERPVHREEVRQYVHRDTNAQPDYSLVPLTQEEIQHVYARRGTLYASRTQRREEGRWQEWQ